MLSWMANVRRGDLRASRTEALAPQNESPALSWMADDRRGDLRAPRPEVPARSGATDVRIDDLRAPRSEVPALGGMAGNRRDDLCEGDDCGKEVRAMRRGAAAVRGGLHLSAVVWRLVAAVCAGIVGVVLYSGPAAAHGADAPVAVGYVVRVASVSVAGVQVRAVEGGARLELVNRSGREVVVLGLQGEPFLRVSGRGVEENRQSPTWFASRSISGSAAGGSATAAPEWHLVANQPRVRWHDERARELPARAWSVPLLVDGREPGIVRGSVAAVPAPRTGWWWAGGVLGAVVVGLLWRLRTLLAVAAVGGGVVASVWIVQSAVLAASPADGVGAQVLARLWPLVAAVGVVAAGVLSLFKRVDIVVAIAGACLAVMVGVGDSAVFRYGTLAGPTWGRWGVVVALAVGAGLAVAGGLRWYQAAGEDSDQEPSDQEPSDQEPRDAARRDAARRGPERRDAEQRDAEQGGPEAEGERERDRAPSESAQPSLEK
ncbi:hypothetical protein ACQP2P_36845 [Dactylosporangium sp. CA-139114]|uniref:hypothetical protein n=1 Tax=Dactylosporangium sp. CA-139114 TaxID=3239931 RepID=UPI003D994870